MYLSLHYQPEATSFPINRKYADQYKLAYELSNGLDGYGIELVIKEHPSIFSPMLRGDRGRYLNFYEDLSRLNNTTIASLESPVKTLLEDSLAVISINGTASVEKAALGGKAAVFTEHWGSVYPTFQKCNTIKEFIDWIISEDPKAKKTKSIPVVYNLTRHEDVLLMAKHINNFIK